MRRCVFAGLKLCVMLLVVGVVATPVASAQQSLSFSFGGFTPKSEDGRSSDDVLVANLSDVPLVFNVNDFNTVTFGADYLVGLGSHLEAGLGIGFYQQSVPSVYADVINSNGAEIEQTLKLRVSPFNATVRFLPLGRNAGVQPYIGGGVGVFNWRYSESGEWVDRDDFNSIFRQTYVGSGSVAGPMILGGLRVPVGSFAVGGELRWQSAEGDLPADQQFAGSKIDLGGFTYLFSFGVHF
jgi:hypothetical protein